MPRPLSDDHIESIAVNCTHADMVKFITLAEAVEAASRNYRTNGGNDAYRELNEILMHYDEFREELIRRY